jgi:hypothetical protein
MMRTRSLLAHGQFLMDHLAAPDGPAACRVRRAITAQDLERAYRLGDGAADGAAWQAVTPPAGAVHRTLPETAVFIAECDDRIVGVLALVPDTPTLGLPGDDAFGRELNLLREMGSRAAEPTHVALAPDAPALLVLAELFRAVVAQALHDGYDDLFMAVAGRYDRLAEEVFQFDRWDMQKADRSGRPGHGKRLCLAGLRPRVAAADRRLGREAFLYNLFFGDNAYHDCVHPWSVMASKTFHDAEALRPLVVAWSVDLDALPQAQRDALRQRWGEAVFAGVLEGAYPDLAMA